jgi:hypothetical protein
VADDPAIIEPVFGLNSLRAGNSAGNFVENPPFRAILVIETFGQSSVYKQIPRAMKQGIFMSEQGIFCAEQGIVSTSSPPRRPRVRITVVNQSLSYLCIYVPLVKQYQGMHNMQSASDEETVAQFFATASYAFNQEPNCPETPANQRERLAAALIAVARFCDLKDPRLGRRFFELASAMPT